MQSFCFRSLALTLTPRLLLLVSSAMLCLAQTDPIPNAKTPNNEVGSLRLKGVVRAKASPDECYLSLGGNVRYDFINQADPAAPCLAGKVPKVNQSYVWGIVVDGNNIFFGTTPNGHCITHGGVVTNESQLKPYQTDSWACEFGVSPYSTPKGGPLPPRIGDFRPPRFYVYDRTLGTITDITPKGPVSASNPLGLDQMWLGLRGARASIVLGDFVVVGGPALSSDGRLSFFAYQKSTKQWVAKYQTPAVTTTSPNAYDNIRRFVVHNDVAYAGVGKSVGQGEGGAVIRLSYSGVIPPVTTPGVIPVCVVPTGQPGAGTSPCFVIQKVGDMDGEGAYLTVHNNRLFVTTWPKPGNAGLWMSPDIPAGGLTSANTAQWSKVWSVENYEPDPVLASSYAGGAVFSWNGYLWWGTMNVPWSGPGRHAQVYGFPTDKMAQRDVIKKTWRAVVLFRAKNFELGTPQIELLYGSAKLWKYNPPVNTTPGSFVEVNNNSNLVPMYGGPGFGNPYNNYVWSMAAWNNKLYVGTMDWSYMATRAASLLTGEPPAAVIPVVGGPGGDLYVFNNTTSAALLETDRGFGNYGNYGFRNLIPIDSTRMYLGMANGMNLMTSPTDGRPDGGWELIEANPRR
jgi:hypothetical protein